MINGSIVRLEALSDCLLLLETDNSIGSAFKEAARRERHFALMAGASGARGETERELLRRCREAARSGAEDERLQAKLALALGLAAWGGIGDPAEALGDKRVYGDALLYRLHYIKGDAPGPEAASVRALLKAMRQRNTIELHTFVANTAIVDEWIELMSRWESSADPELDAFAAVVADPELERLAEPPAGGPFYARGDALLALIERLRRGEAAAAGELEAALAAEPASLYARSVRNGYRRLQEAQTFFAEKTG
ncbi:hypothetical protein [Paenibacillus humicola]|uniref:hypothetical protein n=1 Tax=Paenibacillus humicola TaxID=3110540 RepID=UPI00237B4010|nr:hypothetical protein [Paenibacillus humicola]